MQAQLGQKDWLTLTEPCRTDWPKAEGFVTEDRKAASFSAANLKAARYGHDHPLEFAHGYRRAGTRLSERARYLWSGSFEERARM